MYLVDYVIKNSQACANVVLTWARHIFTLLGQVAVNFSIANGHILRAVRNGRILAHPGTPFGRFGPLLVERLSDFGMHFRKEAYKVVYRGF